MATPKKRAPKAPKSKVEQRDDLLKAQREIQRKLAALDEGEETLPGEELEEEQGGDGGGTTTATRPPVTAAAKPPAPASGDDLDARRGPEDFYLAKDNSMVVFVPNHQLMAKPGVRQQDGKRQRFFYYRRLTDDMTLCFTEAEAANITGKGSTHRHILRQIGVSDGSAYANYIRNCGVKPGEVIPLARAKKILAEAQEADIAAAAGHYSEPMGQNVIFDKSFPMNQRAGFVPPE